MYGNGTASLATTAALCELLTPLCSLRESCQLWREFVHRQRQDSPSADCIGGGGCSCGCPHCCHGNSSDREYATDEDAADEAPPSPPQTSFVGSAADVRRAAFDNWLAAKKRAGASCDAGRGASRAAAEAAAEAGAVDKRRRREEGEAAYSSWLLGKKRLGSGVQKKPSSTAPGGQEQEQKRADAASAIARWRERKDAELGERRRAERQRQADEARAREAEATDRRATAASAMDTWAGRKAEASKARRVAAKAPAEGQSEADRQLREEEKRANSSRAFQEWSSRKAEASKKASNNGSAAESESGGVGQRKRAWRPNATSRRK